MLVKRVFLVVMAHPFNGKGAAAADHAQQAIMAFHPAQGVPGQAAVDGHEINAVLGLLLDGGQHLVHGDLTDLLFLPLHHVRHRLIHRDRAQGDGAVGQDAPAHFIQVFTHAEIHDRIGAGFEGNAQLFQLLLQTGHVLRGADIGIDLGAEPLAHGHDALEIMVFVLGNGNDPLGHASHQRLGRDGFVFGAGLEQGGHFAVDGVFADAHLFFLLFAEVGKQNARLWKALLHDLERAEARACGTGKIGGLVLRVDKITIKKSGDRIRESAGEKRKPWPLPEAQLLL